MKKHLLIFSIFVILPVTTWAQYSGTDVSGVFQGGFGATIIDEELYYTINFQPEISLGKLGAGFNIDLLYNPEAEEGEDQIRSEDLRLEKILRYVRWGHKYDNFYARVLALDHATLGHGFILSNYQNQVVENDRKLGVVVDMDFGMLGFETFTSNLKRLELVGGRAYARPLSPILDVPIIKNTTIGATYVSDMDPDGDVDTDDEIVITGFDLGVPIIDADHLLLEAYADVATIKDYGSGEAIGAMLQFRGLDPRMLKASLRVEERFLQDEFISQYFDAFYELDRETKHLLIPQAESVAGTFGELHATVAEMVNIIGAYEYINETDFGGTASAKAYLEPNAIPRILLDASYNKTAIETFEDLVTLDERSIARARAGFGITPNIFLTMHYEWTFHRDDNGRLITNEKVNPRLDFVYTF